MMLSDTLNAHLEEVDSTAAEIYDRLISQLAKQEGITEQMKATNQMEWVQQMNNIRNRAAEAVRKELLRRIANAIRISHPVGILAGLQHEPQCERPHHTGNHRQEALILGLDTEHRHIQFPECHIKIFRVLTKVAKTVVHTAKCRDSRM